jgi:Cu(I)/Ag(I) efflux system membrane fusion protein
MKRIGISILVAAALSAGAAGGYYYASQPHAGHAMATITPAAPTGAASDHAGHAVERTILYFRDPSGAPSWSTVPKKDAQGRDWLPVYDDQEPSFDPEPPKTQAAQGSRRILYYRNPMGLPDVSPVPKKDSMGMDYIPVYEGEDDEAGIVKVNLARVQRSGVRTEPAQARVLVQPVRAIGTVALNEQLLTIVTLRSDGYIEDLFVNTTGQAVRRGEPLFRVYSAPIQQAQTDLIVAMRAVGRGTGGADAERSLEGAMQRLRNLGVPESRIEEVRKTAGNPRTIDWPAPATGTVIVKRVINGQRVTAGEELYRIADLTRLWVIADVAEGDLGMIRPGTSATVTFRAYPGEPVEAKVGFVYPDLRPETRTVRVRLEVPNPDGRLKPDMYADVVFNTGHDGHAVVAVPSGAVIDSGARQVVLVARGEGRFEPRPVKLGRRGEGFVEVTDGLAEGEEIVTTATFLIDAESNLRAALKTFAQPEAPK